MPVREDGRTGGHGEAKKKRKQGDSSDHDGFSPELRCEAMRGEYQLAGTCGPKSGSLILLVFDRDLVFRQLYACA
jgi:hypothetical protein